MKISLASRLLLTVGALSLALVPTAHAQLIITEVMPGGSAATYAADWFELTNKGASALNISGFKVDDSSAAFATALALQGVTSIAPGESVVFMESAGGAAIGAFQTFWGGLGGIQLGFYSGAGIGLSSSGDAVNIFDSGGSFVSGVTFGANATTFTFDNHASTNPASTLISALSVDGQFGAFASVGTPTSFGSPGAIANAAAVPEPSTYAAIFGALALSAAVWSRRRAASVS